MATLLAYHSQGGDRTSEKNHRELPPLSGQLRITITIPNMARPGHEDMDVYLAISSVLTVDFFLEPHPPCVFVFAKPLIDPIGLRDLWLCERFISSRHVSGFPASLV